jgi:hypothetical protein
MVRTEISRKDITDLWDGPRTRQCSQALEYVQKGEESQQEIKKGG